MPRLAAALSDRYRLARELGQGGMATVYLAHDRKHDRQVAIKVLRPELSATLGDEPFLREIEVAARLVHPHILGLLDSGDGDGFFYSVMPYVEGETLRAKLDRETQLGIEEEVGTTTAVAPGSAFAVGTPRPLFSLSGYRAARNRQPYDVAPDDRHFRMIREPNEGGGGTVVYVENWFQELQTTMMAKQ